ncbi:hypothetical protein B0H17DRAFT_1203299 [Mycena rosella]|uniref:Helicase C-terminal domain-containing protein n=1 Tax=Mycena rosella TaxID=1033263 RepID=A0AAD7GGJ3_MYCRO|nr:hypothetical protein B0H17DRAFT_1203299 [Mycena rosella]
MDSDVTHLRNVAQHGAETPPVRLEAVRLVCLLRILVLHLQHHERVLRISGKCRARTAGSIAGNPDFKPSCSFGSEATGPRIVTGNGSITKYRPISAAAPEGAAAAFRQDLLKHEPFFDRVCALGVDEIHLLLLWGLAFRKAFTQIGFMRARFRSGIPMIGLTATLLWDSKVADAIFGMLGILFRTLHSGIDGLYFPEFALVFRLKIYLDSLLPPGVNRTLRNLETIALFKSDPRCQIIVATNGLAQGNDISIIKTVIQVGEPESAEMFVQKPGRARPNVDDPRTIFYISATRQAKALTVLAQSDAENTADAKKEGTVAMDRPVAQIIAARCKPFIQDELYDNPEADSPCICQSCLAHPPATRPAASDHAMGLTPLTEFLPDVMIKHILDNFAQYKQLADISDTRYS